MCQLKKMPFGALLDLRGLKLPNCSCFHQTITWMPSDSSVVSGSSEIEATSSVFYRVSPQKQGDAGRAVSLGLLNFFRSSFSAYILQSRNREYMTRKVNPSFILVYSCLCISEVLWGDQSPNEIANRKFSVCLYKRNQSGCEKAKKMVIFTLYTLRFLDQLLFLL